MYILIGFRLFILLPLLAPVNANFGFFNREQLSNSGHVIGVVSKYYDDIPEISAGSCVLNSFNSGYHESCEMDLFIGESVIIQCEQFENKNNILYLTREPIYISKGYSKSILEKYENILNSSYIEMIKPNVKITKVSRFGYNATLIQWPWNRSEADKQYNLNFVCKSEHDKTNTTMINSYIKIRLMPSPEYRMPIDYLVIDESSEFKDMKYVKYYKHLTYGQDLKVTCGKTFYMHNLNTETVKNSKKKNSNINHYTFISTLLNLNSEHYHKFITIDDVNSITVHLKNPANLFKKDEENPVHFIICSSHRGITGPYPSTIMIYLFAPTYYSRLNGCGKLENSFNNTKKEIINMDHVCYIDPNKTQTIALHCNEGNHLLPSKNFDVWKNHSNEDVPLSDTVKIQSIKKISSSLTILSYSPLKHDSNELNYMNNYDIYKSNIASLCKIKDTVIDSWDIHEDQLKYVFAKRLLYDFENDPTLIEAKRNEIFLYPGEQTNVMCPYLNDELLLVQPIEENKIYIKDPTNDEFKLTAVDINDYVIGLKKINNKISAELIYSYFGVLRGKTNEFYIKCYSSSSMDVKDYYGLIRIVLMSRPLPMTNGLINYERITKIKPGEIFVWSILSLNDADLKIDCSKFFQPRDNIQIDIYPNEWNTVIIDKPHKTWAPETAVIADFGHSFLSNGFFFGKNNKNPNIISAYIGDYATLISSKKIPFYYVCIATTPVVSKDDKLTTSSSSDPSEKNKGQNKINAEDEIPPKTLLSSGASIAVFEWVPPTLHKRIKGCGLSTNSFIDDNGNNHSNKSCHFNISNRDLYDDPIAFHCPMYAPQKSPIKCYDRSNFVDYILHRKNEVQIFKDLINANELISLWYVIEENINQLALSHSGYINIHCFCYDQNENIISSISLTSNSSYIIFNMLLTSLFILSIVLIS